MDTQDHNSPGQLPPLTGVRTFIPPRAGTGADTQPETAEPVAETLPEAELTPDSEPAEETEGPVLASFSERFVAYVIDSVPFFALCYITLFYAATAKLVVPSMKTLVEWNLGWIALYCLYVTVFTAGGRVTAGKAIMGLRVRSQDGGDISLFRAAVRTAGYFLSSAIFYLGYLLALFTGYALHDHLVGTYVERVRPRTSAGVGGTVLLAWVLFSLFFYVWVYGLLRQVNEQSRAAVAQANNGLYGIARLQALHKEKYGFYADRMARLSEFTGDPARFRKDILSTYQEEGFYMSGDKDSYEISARALDFKGSRVKLVGPPDSVRGYYKKRDYEKFISN